MEGLGKCPFCGGPGVIMVHNPQGQFIPAGAQCGANRYYVRCTKCKASTWLHMSVEEAKSAWDRRVNNE